MVETRRKVAMKFGSLTTAATPLGSGSGGTGVVSGGGGGTGTVTIESVEDYPETEDSGTIYLVKRYFWASTTENLTNTKFLSVDELPPDPDPNIVFLIRRH